MPKRTNMSKVRSLSLLAIILTISFSVTAQNAKKNYKSGQDFVEAKNYKDAIDQFSKAIELDGQYTDAYAARAAAYEKIFKLREAIADYLRASTFDVKEPSHHCEAARLYNLINEPKKAIESANNALEVDKKNLNALNQKASALIQLEQYKNALDVANASIENKKTSMGYYYHGKASVGLKDFEKAEYDFGRAVYYDDNNIEAYVELAKTLTVLNKLEEAVTKCDKGLEKDKNNVNILIAKAQVFQKKRDYPTAINNLSQALLVAKPDEKHHVYTLRGNMYKEFGQHDAAINDFTQVITEDKDNFDALYSRASSFEATFKYKAAIKDYEKLLKLSPYNETARNLLKEAGNRLYELNREENAPVISFTDPIEQDGVVKVPKDWKEIEVKGQITDESKIKNIIASGVNATFDKDMLNPEFSFPLSLEDGVESIDMTVVDVYGNKTATEYKVKRTEINAPRIRLIAPYASDDGEIYLENNDNTVYIEGTVSDESLIKSVFIEGASASFLVDEYNPSFSATISIANKNVIVVTATDIYGNKATQEFKLNREGAALSASNPMGKTWVIFIENSKYSSFASLDGPSKDVTVMKTALARYQIHNVIRKRDMSKSDFERFFSIELRDLVRSNKVNSVLIWYAGHGKFINETGYWIPVDARRDDEFTYFNINSLKASMQSYSKFITHTLVVTDACESGPSFYQAMRSTPTERVCNDWQATKFKSSQVFSSAGYELASDNSQFTKTFANSLLNNPNACIPIEKIVTKVTDAVAKNNSQKPKFGKIDGLEDENGTFFFMKK
jgi:tetratricopeptide (TPR) repeat protein